MSNQSAKTEPTETKPAAVSLWSATLAGTSSVFDGLTLADPETARAETARIEAEMKDRFHAFSTRVRSKTLARRLR